MDDPFDLQRFVTAQDRGGTYAGAVSELRAGRKTSHWMWFVFPQLAGLGQSSMSSTFAISSLEEARAYLAHPVLATRLRECAGILRALTGRTALEVFGATDALKLQSSLTLFAEAVPGESVFQEALDRYFAGARDAATKRFLASLS